MISPKVRIAVIAMAIACAPTTSMIQPAIVPGVDASARRLLGPASPGVMTSLPADDPARDFSGTVGAQAAFSQFVERISLSGKPIIVLSFGSPYLLSAFPSVSSYLLAWGGSPISQRAAALAALGEREINGGLPISLPPALPFGAGIHRAQTGMSIQ